MHGLDQWFVGSVYGILRRNVRSVLSGAWLLLLKRRGTVVRVGEALAFFTLSSRPIFPTIWRRPIISPCTVPMESRLVTGLISDWSDPGRLDKLCSCHHHYSDYPVHIGAFFVGDKPRGRRSPGLVGVNASGFNWHDATLKGPGRNSGWTTKPSRLVN